MKLLETLLSDKYYMLTFGAFECKIIINILIIDDPAIGNGIRPHHREFLKNKSYYKKIVDFKEQNILNRIHQNYRITYLRDSVIGTIIDDPLTNHYNTVK